MLCFMRFLRSLYVVYFLIGMMFFTPGVALAISCPAGFSPVKPVETRGLYVGKFHHTYEGTTMQDGYYNGIHRAYIDSPWGFKSVSFCDTKDGKAEKIYFSTGATNEKYCPVDNVFALNDDFYGLTDDNTWAAEFSYGTLYGRTVCSATPGETNFETGNPDINTPGTYCWVQTTKYRPYNSNQEQTLNNPWVFYDNFYQAAEYDYDSTDSCIVNCLWHVLDQVRNDEDLNSFRSALLGTTFGETEICGADLYDIEYELNGGEFSTTLRVPWVYTVDKTVDLPVPLKAGYKFGGWYDNIGLSGNVVNEIPTGSTGHKKFYAKWDELNCDSGLTAMPILDANIDGKQGAYSFRSIDGQREGRNADDLQANLNDGEWITHFDYGYVKGTAKWSSWYPNDIYPSNDKLYRSATDEQLDEATGLTEFCWCKMTEYGMDTREPVTTPNAKWTTWAYTTVIKENNPRSCASLCANSVLYEHDFRSAIFGSYAVDSAKCNEPLHSITYKDESLSGEDKTVNDVRPQKFKSSPNPTRLATISKSGQVFNGYCLDSATCSEENITNDIPANRNTDVIAYTQYGCESGKYMDKTTNECAACPDNYPESDNGNVEITSCYKSWSCDTQPTCPDNISGTCSYASDILDGRDYNDGTTPEKHCRLSFECTDGYEKNSDSDTCEPITYTITYNSNGGTEIQSDTYVTNINNPKVLPSPTKLGFTFAGWYANAGFNGSAINAINPGDFGDKTFYAKWTFDSCPDGYRQSCSFGIRKGTVLTAFASKSLDGTTDDFNNATPETYGLTQPGQWGSTFDHGDIIGISKCSASNDGGKISGQAGNPTNTDGRFCWCKATRFIPADGNGTVCDSTSGQWIILGTKNTTENCNLICAQDCALWQKGDDVYRSNVYTGGLTGINSTFWNSLVGYNNDICVLSTYTISYVMNSGQFPVGANQKTTYQYEDDTITIPAPIRSGYDFLGWCDNAELTENCSTSKTISYHSYGDKIFYAKWNFTGCDEGYTFYQTNVSDLDTSTNGTSYGQVSISGANSSYASDNGLTSANGYGPGSWATNFDYGRIYGVAKCSSRSGNNHGNKWNGLVSDWSVSDEILNATTDGEYCWCSLTDFLPLNGTKQSVLPKSWIYGNMYTDCKNSCAAYCATTLRDNFYFRSALYGGQCRADSYTIKYMDGEIERTDLSPQKYTIENSFNLPVPIKFGYTLDGWYDNSDFRNDKTQSISVGTTGDKIFYAKWVDAQCPDGYSFKTYEPALVGANFSINSPYSYRTFNGGMDRIGGLSLEQGEWAKQLPFSGIVFGNSVCSAKTGVNHDKITTDELAGFDSGENCWCQLTEFMPTDGTSQELSKTSWVYTRYTYPDRPCQNNCSLGCAGAFSNKSEFRDKIVGACEPNTYTIIFDSLGGTEIESLDYKVTDTITLPAPERNGYVFKGWCIDSLECDTPVKGSQTDWFEDKTLYAQWDCEPGYHLNANTVCEKDIYFVTFKDGDTILSQKTYTIESEESVSSDIPEKNGYVFVGWCDSIADASQLSPACPETVTVAPEEMSDKTFYAQWMENTPSISECGEGYDVYYNPLSGMDNSKAGTQYGYLSLDGALTSNADVYGLSDNGTWGVTFDYGKVIGNSTCDEHLCICSLTGFIPDNNGVYGELQPVSTNRTITPVGYGYSSNITNANDGCRNGCAAGCASWVSSSSGQQRRETLYANICLPITYTIHFVSNGGTEEYPDREYTVESETITLPTDVTRDGYTFGGWYETNEFTGEQKTEVPQGSTGDKTFYAKWDSTEPLSCPPDYELITNLSELDKRINSGNGMWPYGQIPTEAVCSASASGEPDTTTQGGYCWCRVTGLKTKDNVFHAVPTAPWTFGAELSNYDNCTAQCSGEVCRRFKANESRREAMYKGDLDTPACVEKTYMVQYIPNGGTITPTDPRFFYTATSSSVGKPTSISKTGYTFAGWCESEEDANDANIVSCQMETNVQPSDRQDKTFYAKWIEVPIEPEFECASKAWLHIGDAKACLSKTKVSSPAFALKTPKSTYYLQTSLDSNLRLNKDTLKKLRMDFNGTTYNIHDETVLENGGGSSDTGNGNESGNNDGSSTEQNSCILDSVEYTNGTTASVPYVSEWARISSKKIKGYSFCTVTDNPPTTGARQDSEEAKYCWCRLTDYVFGDRNQQSLTTTPWVYVDTDNTNNCKQNCPNKCVDYFVSALSGCGY